LGANEQWYATVYRHFPKDVELAVAGFLEFEISWTDFVRGSIQGKYEEKDDDAEC